MKEIIELPPACFVCQYFSYKENAEKLAKIRAERAARQEAYEKEQALRKASQDKAAAVAKEQDEIEKEKQAKKPAAKKPAAKKAAKPAEEAKPEEK